MYPIVKLGLTALLRAVFRMRVTGREHEPRDGPFIVVANHWSYIDPPAMGCAVRRRLAFMAKAELFRPGILNWFMRSMGSFPVRRGESDRAAIRAALEVVARSGALAMFPEGTRNPRGALMPAQPGAAFLALRAGVPILPMGIRGTLEAFPKGAKLPRPRPIQVRIGPPIRLDDIPRGRDQVAIASDRIMRAIATLLEVDPPPPAARAEAAAADRPQP
ncbi:MAG: 1-acyl-sn-glycerol-3-phosphate acyltransferase [Armatimonadetes bacterium]|nr:1-acyl-sn-glycerol-3-phosphate acyltransferase [Armatimonadota bacterium]